MPVREMVWDVRKGRAGYDQTSFGPVAQTGATAATLADSVRGTPLRRTHRWREMDSNHWSLAVNSSCF
jgi:hypothetical protein